MQHIGILEYFGFALSGAFVTAWLALVVIKAAARSRDRDAQSGGSAGGMAAGGWQ